jgi:hypothetical protein
MNAKQQRLLDSFFRGSYDSWSQYKERAAILWEGEYYVLIRTGMSENKSRYVYLADKLGLLAVDEDDDEVAPLERLAGSLIHPVQAERANDPETLHDSCQDEGSEGLFKGRWCKTRKAQCIAHAKGREAGYEQDLVGWIADYDQRKAAEKALEQEERSFAARVVRQARREVRSAGAGKVKMDCRYDNGIYGTRVLELGEVGTISFETHPEHHRIELQTYHRCNLIFNESQFRRFVSLLSTFAAEEQAE